MTNIDNSQSLVSVIMPVYNAMPYLDQAIRSIYAQTYKNWELIIVDDASTDGSWEFVNKINDIRVRVFRNERNMKNSFTCNKAIMLAKGEFIAKMDADDMSFPERIERQIDYLSDCPNVDVVGCGFYRVDKHMNLLAVYMPPELHENIVKFISVGKNFIFGPFFHMTDGCLLGKKEWFIKWKYDPDIPFAQDFDLNLRSHYASTFANISEPLYVYRKAGITSSWLNQTRAVYYKFVSLTKYGFKKSNMGLSVLSLVSLAMRPLFVCLTELYVLCFKRKKESDLSAGENCFIDDERRIHRLIEATNQIRFPLK